MPEVSPGALAREFLAFAAEQTCCELDQNIDDGFMREIGTYLIDRVPFSVKERRTFSGKPYVMVCFEGCPRSILWPSSEGRFREIYALFVHGRLS